MARWKTFAVLFMTLVLAALPAQASGPMMTLEVAYAPIHFIFDGQQYEPPADQKAFIYEGRTYLPIRFVGYLLNKQVTWNQDTYTVSLTEPTEEEAAALAQFREAHRVEKPVEPIDHSLIEHRSIRIGTADVTFLFDGVSKMPAEGIPGIFYQQRLFVPVRFLAEALGAEIEWDPETYSVIANLSRESEDPAEPQNEQIPPQSDKESPAAGGPSAGSPEPGNGGGAAPSPEPDIPTKQELIDEAAARLTNLKNVCMEDLLSLASQYLNSEDPDEKERLEEQGYAKFDECDAKFERIVSGLEEDLRRYNYDLSVIGEIREEYERTIEAGKKMIENMR